MSQVECTLPVFVVSKIFSGGGLGYVLLVFGLGFNSSGAREERFQVSGVAREELCFLPSASRRWRSLASGVCVCVRLPCESKQFCTFSSPCLHVNAVELQSINVVVTVRYLVRRCPDKVGRCATLEVQRIQVSSGFVVSSSELGMFGWKRLTVLASQGLAALESLLRLRPNSTQSASPSWWPP